MSESVYKHRILADIMPFRDVFLTLFFVSVGLMIDVEIALGAWRQILAIALVLMAGKAVLIAGITYRLGQNTRSALAAGFSSAPLQTPSTLRPQFRLASSRS